MQHNSTTSDTSNILNSCRYWETPEVTGINRLPARATLPIFTSRADALSGRNAQVMSLTAPGFPAGGKPEDTPADLHIAKLMKKLEGLARARFVDHAWLRCTTVHQLRITVNDHFAHDEPHASPRTIPPGCIAPPSDPRGLEASGWCSNLPASKRGLLVRCG